MGLLEIGGFLFLQDSKLLVIDFFGPLSQIVHRWHLYFD